MIRLFAQAEQLSPLQHALFLETLIIGVGSLSDWENVPVLCCQNLELVLYGCSVRNCSSWLQKLPNLKALILSTGFRRRSLAEWVTSCHALSTLRQLKLSGYSYQDEITALSGLDNLETLWIEVRPDLNYDALLSLSQLRELHMTAKGDMQFDPTTNLCVVLSQMSFVQDVSFTCENGRSLIHTPDLHRSSIQTVTLTCGSQALRSFSQCPHLHTVAFKSVLLLSALHLSALASAKALRSLVLISVIKNHHIPVLGQLTHLEHLVLISKDPHVTETETEPLRGLVQLTQLVLVNIAVSSAEFKFVQSLTRLSSLQLGDAHLSVSQCSDLRDHPAIESLGLVKTVSFEDPDAFIATCLSWPKFKVIAGKFGTISRSQLRARALELTAHT